MGPLQSDPLTRIKRLQEALLSTGADAALLAYSRSTLYYAGTTHPSIFIITPEDYHLLVMRALDSVLEETCLETDRISSGKGYKDAKEWLKTRKIEQGALGMELDILPATQYFQLSEVFSEFEILDISGLILEQRKTKDPQEIEYTKEACRIVHHGHQRVLQVLREGMTELELSSEIEDAHRRAGHEGLYFIRQSDFFMGRGPVASGTNLSKIAGKIQSITGVGLSSSIPMGASTKTIKKGEMIVVDIPTHFYGYHSDQSRTYVIGRPSDICRIMYGGMKEIADRIIEMLRPGIRCDALYTDALIISEKLGMGPYFMRLGTDSKGVPFIGHGLGLELNEPPLLGNNNHEVLEEGMIIALELEMCASLGEVVKLEDTLLITSKSVELLTITPRDLHQI
ncbi:MAG: aminopeptidase P family protein [Deltaproteobacteria bacterium]|nr:aminopeptidase P family protein [Deltaproteobacteria bacterium]